MGVGAGKVVLHEEDADEDGSTTGHHRCIDRPEGGGTHRGAHDRPERQHREVVEQQVAELLGAIPVAAVVGSQDFLEGTIRRLLQAADGVWQQGRKAEQQS